MALGTEEIIEGLKGATILELNDLVKAIGEGFDVITTAPVVAAGVVVGVAAKTKFDVELTEVGQEKVKVIRAARGATGLNLKGSKDPADGAPKVTRGDASENETNDIKAKLEEVGTTVAVK